VGYLLVRVSEEKIREAIRRKNNSLIDLGLNLLIRFLFIAVLLSMFFLKKFRILFRGVEIVGQGNLGYKIRIPGSDEFGQLADHFNGMTSNLQEAQEELVEKSRMEEELKIAERIQQTLLPDSYPDYPSLSFSSYYNAQTETGGDYFDFIRLDDKTLGLVIADVSGHGVGACLVMSMIRTLIRSYAHLTNNPKKLLTQINDYVFEDTPSNMYATLFYGIYNLETHKLVYSIAGHNAGILYHPGKNQMRTLKTGGMAAGVVNSSIFSNVIKNYEVELEPGEIFIQYTDGVTEAEDPEGNLYEMERLLKTVESSKEKKIEDMFQDIIRDIQVFTRGYVQSDDITMMGFQIEEGKK
jgi:sigma-B regulation protein RsbU (phosphoserine phosphatase)